ncbi:MAG TPA: sodium:solute symporter [Acidobacteriota bacterium]
MNPIDGAVIFLYFVVVFGIGYYYRRSQTAADYFLAGRSVGWAAIGASLFATNISSEHFIGLAGTGAASGLAVGHFEWLAVLMCLILGWVFVPFYLRSGVFTMPEFLERRYGPSARTYLTVISILAYIFTKISVSLYAGSLLLEKLLGWNFYFSAIVMVLATGVYTVVGGLTAVIYTEVLQAVILIGGAVILTILGLNEAGGMSGLRSSLPADFFHMIKPMTDPNFPWTGIFLGAPILGIWYWCTDQVIVQRVLGARDEANAKRGTILAGLLKILPVFILVLPGLIAKKLYPEIRGDEAYPTMVLRLMPVGLVGTMVAALMAALMSSLSATFNSSSTLFTFDLYKKFRPNAPERTLVHVGRLCTVAMVALGILWVPFIKNISSELYIYLQSVQAYISPPIAACFLFGVLWVRANRYGAVAALATGFVLGASRFLLEVLHGGQPFTNSLVEYLVTVNFLHYAVFIFLASSLVLVVASLATQPESRDKLAGLTFATADASGGKSAPRLRRESKGERRANVVYSLLLIALVTGLWVWFR